MAYLRLIFRSVVLSFVFMAFGLFALTTQALTPTPSPTDIIALPTDTPAPTTTPSDTPVPPTPTTKTLTAPKSLNATAEDDSTISLSWASVKGADTYEIYRADSLIAIVSVTSFTDRNLSAETLYIYKVRAASGSVYSGFSSNVGATTFAKQDEQEADVTPTVTPTENPLETPVPTIVIDHGFDVIEVNGQEYGYENVPSINEGDEVVVKGKATAGSVIELVFGSSFTNPTSIADAEGNWEIPVDTEDLLFGNNGFTVKVVNSQGETVYESSTINLDLSDGEGEEEEEVEVTPTIVDNSNSISNDFQKMVLMVIGLILIIIGALIFIGWKKGWYKKLFKEEEDEDEFAQEGIADSELEEEGGDDGQKDIEEVEEDDDVSIGKDRTGLEQKPKEIEEVPEEQKSAEEIAGDLENEAEEMKMEDMEGEDK